MNKTYISTAIPYVNGEPHVGFALELVQADAYARNRRARGEDVFLQGGTDDNSLKNVRAAERDGVSVIDHVTKHADRFAELASSLNVRFDGFVRTGVDRKHAAAVAKLWCACQHDLYKKSYSGLYCVGCEQFYSLSDLSGGCCPEHGTVPELVEEENWFFRLSGYAEKLLALIESGVIEIVPESKRNEVTSFLRQGLTDLCVSRSYERAKGWGIQVPSDPTEVIYVWFDALANYITGCGYGSDDERFASQWESAKERTHVIGKGITLFHAVYWPAFLLSAGIALPTKILVHGYLTVDGRKIGKSNGNGVSPLGLVERYGVDALRWYLLRHIRSTEDSDFSEGRLVPAVNADLADQLGNLVARTMALIRKLDCELPSPAPDGELREALADLRDRVDRAFDRFAVHDAASEVIQVLNIANRYITEKAPWTLIRGDADARGQGAAVLANVIAVLREVAAAIDPFVPDTVIRLRRLLDGQDTGSGHLFPRLDIGV